MQEEKFKVQMVNPSTLKPAEYNPRRLTAKQEETLTKSIKKYKLLDPIVVNKFKGRKNIIISGHQRMKVAQKLGYKEVPVVFVNLNQNKEKELNLLMNKAQGEWDFELLKQFDIEMLLDTGFDDSDLSDIWDEHLETDDDNFNIEKEMKKIKKTNIKLGDMFQLGNSRIICGDSTDPGVIKKLMGKEKADMILSDPPFNISLDYSKGIGKTKNYGGKVNDNKSKAEYREFLKKTISNGLSVSKNDLHCFYYCDPLSIGVNQGLYEELGITNKRVAMWIKNNQNPTPQIAFNRVYEPVVYGIKGKPYLSDIKNTSEILNKEIENGNRTIDDILDMIDIWLVKRLPATQYEHPTEKSPTLHEKALRRCTKINDIVLDLFSGSGSTLIACEQLKRKCFTAEINPIFCQLTINRYESYANKKAKKLN
jgi:DNA modification methylase